jgi:hypothetical protein
MYEMEGPRPVSRRRPADFSASLRRSTTYQGQERSQRSGRPDHRVARGSPRRRLRLSSLPTSPGFPPSRAAPTISSAGGSELSFHQMTGVSPKSKGSSFPFADGSELSSPYVTRGFPSAIYLEVFPFAGGPGPSSHHATRGFPSAAQPEVFPAPVAQGFLRHHVARGFPSAAQPEVFPAPGGPELSSPHVARGFPSAMYLEVFPAPVARGSPCGFPPCRVAPGFPRDQRPQVCPIPDGPGFPPHRWLGVSSLPVAPDFSWP